jgi:hypothetical protein
LAIGRFSDATKKSDKLNHYFLLFSDNFGRLGTTFSAFQIVLRTFSGNCRFPGDAFAFPQLLLTIVAFEQLYW